MWRERFSGTKQALPLPPGMRYFTIKKATKDQSQAARAFMKEEFHEDGTQDTTSGFIDWIFDQVDIDVYGICGDDETDVFAAAVLVQWQIRGGGRCGDAHIRKFAPLVAVNSAMRKKGYFEKLASYIQATGTVVVFPGDTTYAAPRFSPSDYQQRWLRYNLMFSTQADNFNIVDCSSEEENNAGKVGIFFAAFGAPAGMCWSSFNTRTLRSIMDHPNIRVVAFKQQHLAILQVDRTDCVRILWYAGSSPTNCLKFLKAISAHFERDVLIDSTHPHLSFAAICEETEENDKTKDYTFYHTSPDGGYLAPKGCVAVPCYV